MTNALRASASAEGCEGSGSPEQSRGAGEAVGGDAVTRARDEAARGDVLYLRGEFKPAIERFQEAVRLVPGEALFHYKLACAAAKGGEQRLAEPHFLEAIRLNPGHASAHDWLAQWYLNHGQPERALGYSETALRLAPDNPYFIISRASVLNAAGDARAAWELLEPLVGSARGGMWLAVNYAAIARKIGHELQAAALIERVLRESPVATGARPHLHYLAAGLLDAAGLYDEAFAQARVAKEVARLPFDPAFHSEIVSRRLEYFSKQNLQALPRATHGSRRPVFILGMPRSGTSLVEQILASHPDVFGGGELDLLLRAVRSVVAMNRAKGAVYPESLDFISVADADRLAAGYLDGIASLNADARYVTDKMPMNFQFLGLAEVLLPDCRVIHCVRDPRDTCLSCYLTGFATDHEFTGNLGHLAAFYRDYVRMMEHWKKVLTVPILEVRYEDVVADMPGQARRMLEFLDLPWDDRCLSFHENKRHVPTASRDQVRKPLYASSIGRWKHYERHIPELLALVPGIG
ncbi:MAG: uncharacterized protein JWN51_2533 [Phycisphaerales bacterium]|nr:uncharacterized protein [Phycisphaerales bacterium]